MSQSALVVEEADDGIETAIKKLLKDAGLPADIDAIRGKPLSLTLISTEMNGPGWMRLETNVLSLEILPNVLELLIPAGASTLPFIGITFMENEAGACWYADFPPVSNGDDLDEEEGTAATNGWKLIEIRLDGQPIPITFDRTSS